MAIITVRVSEELKRRMGEMRHVNWSEVVRQAITRVLEGEGERSLARAVLLNERSVVVPDEGFDSVGLIREWRGRVRWRR